MLVPVTQHTDLMFLNTSKWSPRLSLVTICRQRYYIIIDYIPHTVHFIPVTHLLCSWKFVPLNRPHPFLSSPHPSLATTCLFSVSITLFLFCYVYSFVLFFWIPHISEIIQYLSFSVWLFSLSMITSRSIHVVANGKWQDFILFYSQVIFHCVYVYIYKYVCVYIYRERERGRALTSSLSLHLLLGT